MTNTITKRETKARNQLKKFDFRLNKVARKGYTLTKGSDRIVHSTIDSVEDHIAWLVQIRLEGQVQIALSDFLTDGGDPLDAVSIVLDEISDRRAA